MANGIETPPTDHEKYLAVVRAHRTYVVTIIKESQAEYGKQLLALSSATLAVSVAFLRNLVEVHSAVWMRVLYAAWVLFVATIVLTLISIQVSIEAHKRARDDLDKVLKEEKKEPDERTWGEKMIPRLSWLTSACFVGGFACLALFAVINVRREHAMPEQTHDTQTLPSGVKEDGNKNYVEVQKMPPVKQPPPPPPPPEKPPER